MVISNALGIGTAWEKEGVYIFPQCCVIELMYGPIYVFTGVNF